MYENLDDYAKKIKAKIFEYENKNLQLKLQLQQKKKKLNNSANNDSHKDVAKYSEIGDVDDFKNNYYDDDDDDDYDSSSEDLEPINMPHPINKPEDVIDFLKSKLEYVSRKHNSYIEKLKDNNDDYDIRILVNIDFKQNNNYNKSNIVSGIQNVILLHKNTEINMFPFHVDNPIHNEELLREIPVFKDILDKIIKKINKNDTEKINGGKSRKKQTRINKNKTKKHK